VFAAFVPVFDGDAVLPAAYADLEVFYRAFKPEVLRADAFAKAQYVGGTFVAAGFDNGVVAVT